MYTLTASHIAVLHVSDLSFYHFVFDYYHKIGFLKVK